MPNPFSDLYGRILSTGGEIATALAISYGRGTAFVKGMLERRFPGVDQGTIDDVIGFGQRLVDAGVEIMGLDPEDPIPPPIVPVNEFLFGGCPEGQRAYWVGEFSVDAGESWVQRRFSTADLPTQGEVLQLLIEQGATAIGESPKVHNLWEEKGQNDIQARVLAAQRCF